MLLAAIFAVLCTAAPTGAASLHIAWDPSDSPAVVGYRIHYGVFPAVQDLTAKGPAPKYLTAKGPAAQDLTARASKHYTKSVRVDGRLTTSAVIDDLKQGRTYFFAVTAFTKDGKESAFSPELTHKIGDPLPEQLPAGRWDRRPTSPSPPRAEAEPAPQPEGTAPQPEGTAPPPQPPPPAAATPAGAPSAPPPQPPAPAAASSTSKMPAGSPAAPPPQEPSQMKIPPSKTVAKTPDGKIAPADMGTATPVAAPAGQH